MCEANDKLATSHSFFSNPSPRSNKTYLDTAWKSDMFISGDSNIRMTGPDALRNENLEISCGEYYKKYEHDEKPVKDGVASSFIIGTGDSSRIPSLTNSMLTRLEHKVLNYDSQELHSIESSINSLESHIKFFKSTVQEIFDTFYSNMRDYEIYKKRYNDILEKNKTDNLQEMEEFIKDMIQHIVSTDPSITSFTTNATYDMNDDGKTSAVEDKIGPTDTQDEFLESYKNNWYVRDSQTDTPKKPSLKSGEIFNIYFVSTTPSIEIKVNDRNLCSEIKIKDQPTVDVKMASADNLRRVPVKKNEPDAQETTNDIEIPIKVSSPKKNIHLNEDFHYERDKTERERERSLLSRFCNYFCKMFRKNA